MDTPVLVRWVLKHTYYGYPRTFLLSCLLHPWSRDLLEMLICSHLIKKFPAFYGTRKFITAFTRAHQLFPSWAISIHSMAPHTTSWRSSLILSSHLCLGLPGALFPSGFPTETLYIPLFSPHTRYMPRLSHSSRFDHPKNIWWGVQITMLHTSIHPSIHISIYSATAPSGPWPPS